MGTGALSVVVRLLSANETHEVLAEMCATVFSNLCFDVAARAELERLRADEALLAAALVQPASVMVQHSALNALVIMATSNAVAVRLARLGASRCAVDALNRHQDLVPNVRAACGMLFVLSSLGNQTVTLLGNGADHALVLALEKHGADAEASFAACSALSNLTCTGGVEEQTKPWPGPSWARSLTTPTA